MVRGRQEIARFAYKDAEETILGYVVRLEDRQETKITPTLTYCRNNQGDQQWRWQGFGDDRPLYGLDQLAQKPEARVLVVEGEKTAEAAKGLFPEYAVITWSGGCGSVHKSDWSPLKDRDVTLWPDNDKAGHNAVTKINDILSEQGNEHVHLVNLFGSVADPLSPALPHKWDLADKLPEGLTVEHLKDFVQQKVQAPLFKEPFSAEHPVEQHDITGENIIAVAKKYALSECLEPNDKTQKIYIRFAQTDFDKTAKHYGFEINPEEIMEKAILTGIVQHFMTTLDRLKGEVSEQRLQETYDKATTAATLCYQKVKHQNQTLTMTAALDQANVHHAKETIHKMVESLPDTEKGKTRRLLKEKSRLQNQFARKLNEDQTKKLTSEVDLHHEAMKDHSHDSSSLRHSLFGDTHNLAHLKQDIQHHHAQQQQTLHHQQIQQPPHPSLTR